MFLNKIKNTYKKSQNKAIKKRHVLTCLNFSLFLFLHLFLQKAIKKLINKLIKTIELVKKPLG